MTRTGVFGFTLALLLMILGLCQPESLSAQAQLFASSGRYLQRKPAH